MATAARCSASAGTSLRDTRSGTALRFSLLVRRLRGFRRSSRRSAERALLVGAPREKVYRRAPAGPGLRRFESRADEVVDAGTIEHPGDDRPGSSGRAGSRTNSPLPRIETTCFDECVVELSLVGAANSASTSTPRLVDRSSGGGAGWRRRRLPDELLRPALLDQVRLALAFLEDVLDVVRPRSRPRSRRRRSGRARRGGSG